MKVRRVVALTSFSLGIIFLAVQLVRVAILGSSGGIAFVIVVVLIFAAAGIGVYFLRRRTRRQGEAIVRQHERLARDLENEVVIPVFFHQGDEPLIPYALGLTALPTALLLTTSDEALVFVDEDGEVDAILPWHQVVTFDVSLRSNGGLNMASVIEIRLASGEILTAFPGAVVKGRVKWLTGSRLQAAVDQLRSRHLAAIPRSHPGS